MKKLLLLILIVSYTSSSEGQSGKLSAGIETALPIGQYAPYYRTLTGGTIRYEHRIKKDQVIMLTTGYKWMGYQKTGLPKPYFNTIVPVLLGIRSYQNGLWAGSYFDLGVGAQILFRGDYYAVKASYAATAGMCYNKRTDIGLQFQLIQMESGYTLNLLGLRAALLF